jgi:aromatic ring-opening dioxygenase catalytic subunit (LigB family)
MDALLCGILPPTDRAGPVPPPVIRRVEVLGDEVARLAPDAVILACARWVTTFQHYVAGAGWLGDLDRPGGCPGDPELARALVTAGVAARVPVTLTEDAALPVDAAVLAVTVDVPIVPISLCSLADLAETLRWGRAIAAAVQGRRRRVVLAVTGAGRLPLLLGALGSGSRGRVSGCGPATAVATLSRD